MQKYTKISAFKSEQDLSVRYIGKEKFHNSSKETALLEEFTDKLVIHPEMFPADKYRKNNEVVSGLMNYIIIGFPCQIKSQ